MDLLRRVPAPLDARKDIVPVDYVAEALLFLLLHESLRWRRYHISAGEIASVTWREMAAVFARHHGERSEVDLPLAVSSDCPGFKEREWGSFSQLFNVWWFVSHSAAALIRVPTKNPPACNNNVDRDNGRPLTRNREVDMWR